MRIDAYNQINQLYGAGKTKKAGNVANTSSVGTKDEVSFSTFGRDLQSAKAALAHTPDIREDKVNTLKKSIQDGSYQVDGESFANKLLAAYNNQGL